MGASGKSYLNTTRNTKCILRLAFSILVKKDHRAVVFLFGNIIELNSAKDVDNLI